MFRVQPQVRRAISKVSFGRLQQLHNLHSSVSAEEVEKRAITIKQLHQLRTYLQRLAGPILAADVLAQT
eukprot:5990399-Amphidinium_carterae.2